LMNRSGDDDGSTWGNSISCALVTAASGYGA
jgi:hypothetical protein